MTPVNLIAKCSQRASKALTALALSTIASISVLAAFTLPAVASDNFALGSSQYARGDYAAAIASLTKYLKANPSSYQAQYMLANCFVQLKDLTTGKRWYALALTNKPDNLVREHCLQAIERIGLASAPPPVQKPSTGVSKSAPQTKEPESSSDEKANQSPQAKRAAEEIEKIMADAKTRADRVKTEQKEALQRYKETDSRWMKKWNGERWERFFGTKPELEAEVTAPYEQQIQKIMDDAEQRCNGVRRDIR